MILNYFKIAWRSIFRNKTFSAINILGLGLGMACSFLILLWIRDEIEIDSFHANDENLYSVIERQYHDGIVVGMRSTPGILGSELKAVLPDVKYSTNTGWKTPATFEANGKILNREGNFAGTDFFNIFSYTILKGNANDALKTTSDIAISKKMAEDFFGSAEEAINKSIRYQNKKDLKITAVFDNVPEASSSKFEYIINWETFLEENEWAKDWGNNGPPAFLVLNEGTDVMAFKEKIRRFIEKYNKDTGNNFRIELDVQKYSDIYLHSNFKDGELSGGRVQYVKLFSVVAVFILLIACINFMNLTTARSIKRGKEIGVRKVVGAARTSLINQFIGEAMLIVFVSFVISLVLVAVTLPVFNIVTHKTIHLPLNDLKVWLSLIGLTILVGFVSGSYPALYLSSFNPVRVLKGSLRFSIGALWFRRGLVIFQFALSIILIVGTIIISRQVSFVQSINLGYNRNNLIYISLEGDLIEKYKSFKDQALTFPGVENITKISQMPTSIQNGTSGVKWEGKDPNSRIQFTQAAIGYDFTATMGSQILEGRDFSQNFPSDSVGYILNESALKIIGAKDPIGMPLTFWDKKGQVVGIIKDFHFNSLHVPIEPLVLRLGNANQQGGMIIRTSHDKTKDVLQNLERLSKELNPQFPFVYEFLDDEYSKLYTSEQIVSDLSNVFAFLAIFISCLGLLGLAMFTTEQRSKEIGIRKVLGASSLSLFNLLSKDLLALVSISMIIATPLAWYVMDNWLKDFAYKINISLWIFVVAGFMAVVIALATISLQTIKALVTSPAVSLKSE